MEAVSLDHIAKRAQIDASIKKNAEYNSENTSHDMNIPMEPQDFLLEDDNHTEIGFGDINEGVYEEEGFDPKGDTNVIESGNFRKNKGQTARVIDVSEKAGCVSMHVPGIQSCVQYSYSHILCIEIFLCSHIISSHRYGSEKFPICPII